MQPHKHATAAAILNAPFDFFMLTPSMNPIPDG
jgi:hypothetical protein